jgi:hypothetical protein
MQMIKPFFDHDMEQAKNMKLLLSVFEQFSGLNINFHKTKSFVMEMLNFMRRSILNSLDVKQDRTLSGT